MKPVIGQNNRIDPEICALEKLNGNFKLAAVAQWLRRRTQVLKLEARGFNFQLAVRAEYGMVSLVSLDLRGPAPVAREFDVA